MRAILMDQKVILFLNQLIFSSQINANGIINLPRCSVKIRYESKEWKFAKTTNLTKDSFGYLYFGSWLTRPILQLPDD